MRAVFLDRDGVINENRADHVKSWDEFTFLPGALLALRWLYLAGFHVFVVTNQAIVGRGVVTAQRVQDINAQMKAQIMFHGGHIHDIRYCPHDARECCACRKPQPGMLLDLATHWRIDLSYSYMIGDAWTDIAAGRAVGCTGIMVRTGRGTEQIGLPEARQYPPAYTANDLLGATVWLLSQEGLLPTYQPRSPWQPAAGMLPQAALFAAGG